MNTIPQTGKWNEISSLLNVNFNTIATQLLQFANVAVYNKGIHADVESLQQSYPTPMVGSFAYVGTTTPYKIYTYRATGWQDSGVTGEPMETDFSDITIATETASGLMSPDHVATLNGFSATINGQTNEITGVKNRVASLERQSETTNMTVGGHNTRITELEEVVNPLKDSFVVVEDTVKEHTTKLASVNNSVTQIVDDVDSLKEYIEDNRTSIETLTQAILNLGVFNSSGDAEKLAETYASNPTVFIMLYKTQGGASGIIYQYFSNTSATIQFLYLQGQRYVREISWGNGTVGAWKNITGPERIKTLSFNDESNILSFEDSLSGKTWGGVYLPFKETAAQEVAKVVANAPADLNTLKEIADYIASDKSNAADVANAITALQAGYGNLKDAIGDVQTALEEEVASNEQMYESLLSSITTAKNDMRSSTPIFDKVVTGEVTLAMGSATTNYQVVYLEDKKMFAALNAGKYWQNWLAWGKYPSAVSYGPAPAVGKVYIMGNALYVWNGSSLNEIGDFDDIKKSIAHNTGAIANNVQAIDLLAEEVETKAPKEGYAPDLKVDFAKELVGRGVAEPQEIGVIRPTGEISIGDGNATIEKVKGKSVVWNQKYPTGWTLTLHGITSISTSGDIVLNGVTTSFYFNLYTPNKILPFGHKGLFSMYIIQDEQGYLQGKSIGLLNRVGKANISGSNAHFFHANTDESKGWSLGFSDNINVGDVLTDIRIRVNIYDLTQMFGAGNEPTTIEEFEARKPLGVSDEYNEGEIISYDANELKSVGFNAWDEEWEIGEWSVTTGKPLYKEKSIRCKDYIRVVEGGSYEFLSKSNTNFGIIFFDSEYQFVRGTTTNPSNRVITIPLGVPYIKMFTSNYGTTYNHDICIHLVHTGYRNGEYQPYKEDSLQLPNIKDIKDKDGNQLFPYGLASAGSAHDEITATKAVKRIGVVDMGTLTWYTQVTVNGNTRFLADLSDIKRPLQSSVAGNVLTPKYQTHSADKVYLENVGIAVDVVQYKALSIYDPNYTEIDSFKQAMSGVMLYYELAEPIEVDLPEPLNLTYDAWDFGTEELIAEVETTPLNADIVYQFNAVDRIRENTEKNKALEKELAELKAQLTQLTQVSNEDNNA